MFDKRWGELSRTGVLGAEKIINTIKIISMKWIFFLKKYALNEVGRGEGVAVIHEE